MAKWKQIATLNDNGTLGYATSGAAATVTTGFTLGQGGTGNNNLDTATERSLMIIKDGKLQPVAPPVSGDNQILAWDGTGSEPQWLDATGIVHQHSQYLDITSSADQTITGNLSMSGNLHVGGTAVFANVSVNIVSTGTIQLDTTSGAQDNKGIIIDDGDGSSADDPGIFWNSTAERWGVGKAGAYEQPLVIYDAGATPTNGATATTYSSAIGTIGFNSDSVFIVVDE
tara:strand:- start:4823 stop:5506 length:684 start_codon:yes stop_codon:yes gene_type:complete